MQREMESSMAEFFSIVGIEAANITLSEAKNTSSKRWSCNLTPMAPPMSFWEHCIPQELSVEIPPRHLFFFFFSSSLGDEVLFSSKTHLTIAILKPTEPFIVDSQPRRSPLPTKKECTLPIPLIPAPTRLKTKTKTKPPKKERVEFSISIHPPSPPSLPPSLLIGHQHREYM